MVTNYHNGKIYRLVSKSGKQYIGSTTQLLCKRKAGHRGDYKKWKEGRGNYISSIELFEEGDVDMVLIENYSCGSKEELHARERFWIETIEGGCVNKQTPNRTLKEYYQEHKDEYKERSHAHYEKNKQDIKERHEEYRKQNIEIYRKNAIDWYNKNKDIKVVCECGEEVTKVYLKQHEKTEKHKRNLNV